MTMDFSKLTAYLDHLDEMQIFARDMMIQLEGKTVYRHFSGVHDAAGREPMDGREVYWMYSMTKPLTIACALKLMEEGKLGFTDPVFKYLPGWRVHPEATVEHLMSMKGGLDYELKAPEILACGPHADTQAIANALANRPLKFVPGTDFQYSLCLDVLAGVIEAASGMKFSEYMSKTLFEPLGMADSSLRLTENQKSRLCAQYQWVEAEKKSVPLGNDNIDYNLTDAYESGGGLHALCLRHGPGRGRHSEKGNRGFLEGLRQHRQGRRNLRPDRPRGLRIRPGGAGAGEKGIYPKPPGGIRLGRGGRLLEFDGHGQPSGHGVHHARAGLRPGL